MQAPLALIDGSLAFTAILVRVAGLAGERDDLDESGLISGTRARTAWRTRPGCVRDTVMADPWRLSRHS